MIFSIGLVDKVYDVQIKELRARIKETLKGMEQCLANVNAPLPSRSSVLEEERRTAPKSNMMISFGPKTLLILTVMII